MALLLSLGLNRVCHAQAPGPTKIEMDLDARSHLRNTDSSDTQLYSATLHLETEPAAGLRVVADGQQMESRYAVQQAAVEKNWGMQRVQGGIIRLPFGISDSRETYASGLIAYPLARGGYWNHSVDWGVPGVQVIGGTPLLQFEVAGFGGQGVGVWNDTSRVSGGALRVQTYGRDFIVGASRWDGSLSDQEDGGPNQPVHLNGLDLRYTRPHLVLRGEYLFGNLGGDQMRGWYLDAYYRLPQWEKVTLVARWEQSRPGLDDPIGRQVTLGMRYVATREWTLAVNWQHNNGITGYNANSSSAVGRSGEMFFQVYRKARW